MFYSASGSDSSPYLVMSYPQESVCGMIIPGAVLQVAGSSAGIHGLASESAASLEEAHGERVNLTVSPQCTTVASPASAVFSGVASGHACSEMQQQHSADVSGCSSSDEEVCGCVAPPVKRSRG